MKKVAVLTPHRTMPRTYPIIEMFGPTIQGEGPDAGRPCQFIRFGGCDYRCSWCDSIYAVDPAEVRKNSERLTVKQIAERLGPTKRVIFSGGNPALFQLYPLVDKLQRGGHYISVETQGSKWRPWLASVNRLVVSPKPPSSGMATAAREAQTRSFMQSAVEAEANIALKIVIFHEADYEWAVRFSERYPGLDPYLSIGTPQEVGDKITKADILKRFRWLAEKVSKDQRMSHAVVTPQMHVLAWGTERGR